MCFRPADAFVHRVRWQANKAWNDEQPATVPSSDHHEDQPATGVVESSMAEFGGQISYCTCIVVCTVQRMSTGPRLTPQAGDGESCCGHSAVAPGEEVPAVLHVGPLQLESPVGSHAQRPHGTPRCSSIFPASRIAQTCVHAGLEVFALIS